jgi:hypothetical protein
MHWKGSKEKGHLQTQSSHKALKTVKTTRYLQRDLATAERTTAGGHPKQRMLAILHHQNRGLDKSELVAEQIEGRGRSRHNKRQTTASPERHTNCKDLERTFRSCGTNSHWPFINARSDVVEVGEAEETLFHSVIVATTSPMSPENQTWKKSKRLDL